MITENQLKCYFSKKIIGMHKKKEKKEKKKKKRLTGIQVLTKDFASYKIIYVFQSKF